MNMSFDSETRPLTIGELVVAVTDAAFAATHDEDEAYEIASLVIADLLQSSAPGAAEHLLAAYSDIPVQ
jgi:PHD/YefM family antitoxin component YafN of YafNO toxin-antitoxin module